VLGDLDRVLLRRGYHERDRLTHVADAVNRK
jgi:hypothetical protein